LSNTGLADFGYEGQIDTVGPPATLTPKNAKSAYFRIQYIFHFFKNQQIAF